MAIQRMPPVICGDGSHLTIVKGDPGVTFTPFVDEDGNLSWENDGGLPNPPTINIKGKDGDAITIGISNLEIEEILKY